MFNWIKTDDKLPEHGQKVLALILNDFTNAPWQWVPVVQKFELMSGREYWGEFSRPTMWCSIDLPQLPNL